MGLAARRRAEPEHQALGRQGAEIAEIGGLAALELYFMKFSRKYETQADILGSQIMARAGYDPRDLANVFRLIESKEGSGGPRWLSAFGVA